MIDSCAPESPKLALRQSKCGKRQPTPKRQRYQLQLSDVPEYLHVYIASFFVNSDGAVDLPSLKALGATSRHWKAICEENEMLWRNVPIRRLDGGLNKAKYIFEGKINEGTEGSCFKCIERGKHANFALKKARVYPEVRINGKILTEKFYKHPVGRRDTILCAS